MQDEPVVCMLQVSGWNAFQELQLNSERRLSFGQSNTVADPKDVRVHGHGGFIECDIEDHIRSFSTHTRQGLKEFSGSWHAAVVLSDQYLTRLKQVAGLAFVKSNGFNVFFKALKPQIQHFLGCVGDSKQVLGCFIDPNVGRLSGEQDGT